MQQNDVVAAVRARQLLAGCVADESSVSCRWWCRWRSGSPRQVVELAPCSMVSFPPSRPHNLQCRDVHVRIYICVNMIGPYEAYELSCVFYLQVKCTIPLCNGVYDWQGLRAGCLSLHLLARQQAACVCTEHNRQLLIVTSVVSVCTTH